MTNVLRETRIMAAICLVDMVLTLWLIQAGLAAEANPLMRDLLAQGVIWFIGFKCLFTFGPLYLLERVAQRHGPVVQQYLRLGIMAYLGMHILNAGGAIWMTLARW
jgi:hypothetical protein